MLSRSSLLCWRLICALLIGTGAATSAFLLERSFALIGDRFLAAFNLCSVMFGTSCDDALLSSMSWVLGIPLAGWGLVYYAVLGWLFVLMLWMEEAFEVEAAIGALLIAGAGALISAGLLAVLVFGSAAFCPLCLVVHAINFSLFPVFKVLSRRSWREVLGALQSAGRYLLRGATGDVREANWKLLGFSTVGLIAVIVFQWVFVEVEVRKLAAEKLPEEKKAVADLARARQHEIPVDDTDPRIGSPEAPAQLIVFSSFQCPACRRFAEKTSSLAAGFGDELSIVFKHFPLSSDCNPRVSVNKQRNACRVAVAAVAAHRQGRFWPFHDAFFASDLSGDEDDIQQAAQQAELSAEQFAADRQDPSSLAKVKRDAELGAQLDLPGTPTVFLNGRRIPNLSSEALGALIRQAIGEPAG